MSIIEIVDTEPFMNTEEYTAFASQRRDTYKNLSTCFFPPEQDTLSQLGGLQASLDQVCPEAAPYVEQMRQETELQQLNIDFSRLFVGPFRLLAAPYGSVYLEDKREVMGVSTLDARKRYIEAGLEFSDDVKEAPDHIAFELEFMYYLVFKEIESLEIGDSAATIGILDRQKAFLIDHLGAWVPRLAAEIEDNAQTDFYKNLAGAANVFVRHDITHVVEAVQAYAKP